MASSPLFHEVRPGNTYRLNSAQSSLFVVVTELDTRNTVILANLSANPGHTAGDAVLEPGDHPYIRRMTGVAPVRTRICLASDIDRGVRRGNFLPLDPVSDEVVDSIRRVLLASNLTKPDVRNYLIGI